MELLRAFVPVDRFQAFVLGVLVALLVVLWFYVGHLIRTAGPIEREFLDRGPG